MVGNASRSPRCKQTLQSLCQQRSIAGVQAAAARAAGKAARRAREGLSTMTPLKPPPLERGYAADAVAGSGGPIATGSGHSGAKQGGGHAVQRDGQNGATAPDLQGACLPTLALDVPSAAPHMPHMPCLRCPTGVCCHHCTYTVLYFDAWRAAGRKLLVSGPLPGSHCGSEPA